MNEDRRLVNKQFPGHVYFSRKGLNLNIPPEKSSREIEDIYGNVLKIEKKDKQTIADMVMGREDFGVEKWYRGKTSSDGWFVLRHEKSGKLLTAKTDSTTVVEGKNCPKYKGH